MPWIFYSRHIFSRNNLEVISLENLDSKYMKVALELARKGAGWVNPNPMVGAVIVKDGIIIGKGYHEEFGGLHAERNALVSCSDSPENATLYVTLEPCCHYGKTPPCTEAIIHSKIARVVIGTLDPNPIVSGKGVEILRSHNIQVEVGVLEEECKELIKIFAHYIINKRPYIVMKYAMTMDGKIATYTNQSRWITGEKARNHVHSDRHNYSSIMVGVNTVINDDPLLTCRLENTKNPIRIICDTSLRTPLTSRIVHTAKEVDTIIATCEVDPVKHEPYLKAGCKIVVVGEVDNRVNLVELMEVLWNMNIDSVILEGGSTLNWSAIKYKTVDLVQVYIAPKLFGGSSAKSPIGGLGIDIPSHAFTLSEPKITRFDEDLLLESEVIYTCLQES